MFLFKSAAPEHGITGTVFCFESGYTIFFIDFFRFNYLKINTISKINKK